MPATLISSKVKRARRAEKEIQYLSKVIYRIMSGNAEDFQKINEGRVANGNIFIYRNLFKISLDTPAHSMNEAKGLLEPCCCPEIKKINDVEYGGLIEQKMTISARQPLSSIIYGTNTEPIVTWNPDSETEFDSRDFLLARQIGPTFAITDAWADPAMTNPAFTWVPSDIAYLKYGELMNSRRFSHIIAVRDYVGNIRHLIVFFPFADGTCAILPLDFAQHPNYDKAHCCLFSFHQDWWLWNSDQLRIYPHAEVVITNEIGFCQKSVSSQEQIVVGYFFGYEMIEHLHLECLNGRKIVIRLIRTDDPAEYTENLREALLLKSRLKGMDIDAGFQVVTEELLNTSKEICGHTTWDCIYTEECSNMSIITEAQTKMIQIPENLRPDRYGALNQNEEKILVKGFLFTGCMTAITAHGGVDLALLACSIVAGLKSGTIFQNKWACTCKIIPACFILRNTLQRHNVFYKTILDSFFPGYEIPCGKQEVLEKCFFNLVKENGFNVFIFEARQIVKEYRETLEFACNWAQKHGIGVVIITSQEDPAADNFFSDISNNDLHVWWTRKRKYEYLVEDRPLLTGEATAFKIDYQDGWNIQNDATAELLELEERNITTLQTEKNDAPEDDTTTHYRS